MTSDKIICLEAGGREELLYFIFFSPGVHRAARKAAPFPLWCTQLAWHSEEEGTDPSEKERNPARCLQLLCNDTHYRASLNKHPGNGLQSTTVLHVGPRRGRRSCPWFCWTPPPYVSTFGGGSAGSSEETNIGFLFHKTPPTHTHTPHTQSFGGRGCPQPLSLSPAFLFIVFFSEPRASSARLNPAGLLAERRRDAENELFSS